MNVALPALTRDLHATTTQLQWVVDAYNLVFAALLLTFGSLSDRFGRKGMLLAGLAVVGAASLAGGFTTSASELIAARAVMGLGAAMTFPATLSLLTNVFTERRERARAIGLWGAIAGVAIALGPIVGGWLLRSFSWGSIFIAMAPVAALALAGVAVAVPASRSPDAARPDVPGLVLSSATTSATLSYGVIAVQMVLYGLGMCLTSAPATEAIMGAVSRSKAGVGSAVNDATRLIGGTLGVAVIGSVYASVYGSRLTAATPAGVPAQVAALAHQSVGAAYAAAGGLAGLGHPALGQALRLASTNAFLHGLTVGALVASGVATAGAILAAVFLPAQPQRTAEPLPSAEPAPSAEPVPSAEPASPDRVM